MNRFVYKMQRFMMGRNGIDRFEIALFFLYIILSVISSFFRPIPVRILPLLLLGYIVYRMLSKNIASRARENDWYCRTFGPLGMKLRAVWARLSDSTHKYFRCPECRQRVRVPKFHGKIEITCPKCGSRFTRDTGR